MRSAHANLSRARIFFFVVARMLICLQVYARFEAGAVESAVSSSGLLTNSLNHSLTHSLTHSLSHSLSLTHSLTHSLAHSLSHTPLASAPNLERVYVCPVELPPKVAVSAQRGRADLSARVLRQVEPVDVCARVVEGVHVLVRQRVRHLRIQI